MGLGTSGARILNGVTAFLDHSPNFAPVTAAIVQGMANISEDPEALPAPAPVPETGVRTLAQGGDAVVAYLESTGISDEVEIDAILEGAEASPGGWPWGSIIDQTDDTVTIVSYFEGVLMVAKGPIDDYFQFDQDGDDEEP